MEREGAAVMFHRQVAATGNALPPMVDSWVRRMLTNKI